MNALEKVLFDCRYKLRPTNCAGCMVGLDETVVKRGSDFSECPECFNITCKKCIVTNAEKLVKSLGPQHRVQLACPCCYAVLPKLC